MKVIIYKATGIIVYERIQEIKEIQFSSNDGDYIMTYYDMSEESLTDVVKIEII